MGGVTARLVFGDENADDNIPSAEFTVELQSMELTCGSGNTMAARTLYDFMRVHFHVPVEVRTEDHYVSKTFYREGMSYVPSWNYQPTLLTVGAVLLG